LDPEDLLDSHIFGYRTELRIAEVFAPLPRQVVVITVGRDHRRPWVGISGDDPHVNLNSAFASTMALSEVSRVRALFDRCDYILDRLLAAWMVYQKQSGGDQVQSIETWIQRTLSIRLEPKRCKNVEALIHVYEGRFESAIRAWIDLLRKFPRYSRGATNFGYYLFHCGTTSQCERVLKQLDYGDMVESGTPKSVKFYLSLLLATGHDQAEKVIEQHFLDRIVEPNVRRASDERTIFFWHVPKCAGTSVTQVLGDHFYEAPISEVLPSYSTLPLLTHCAHRRLERFPFFSSFHLSVSVLGTPDCAFEFVVLRDPLSRALSMFRQTLRGLRTGYPLRVLPKWGHVWNYWQASDAKSMLEAIPEDLLLRQLSTFSEALDVEEAEQRISQLDDCFYLDSDRSFDELYDEIGVEVQASDMEQLNASPKHVHIAEKDRRRIKNRLHPEYHLIDRVTWG